MNSQKFRRSAFSMLLPALLALGLSACDSNTPANATEPAPQRQREFGIPASQAVSIEALKKDGRGFTVGQALSTREVFVFFDPKCPHCALFWSESQKLTGQVKFTWLPVAFMGKGSMSEGAKLLGATDKVEAMTAHASLVTLAMRNGQRLPEPSTETGDPALMSNVARNTRLATSIGADSIPYIVTTKADGSLLTKAGGMSAENLATAMGLSVPTKP